MEDDEQKAAAQRQRRVDKLLIAQQLMPTQNAVLRVKLWGQA